MEEQFKDYLENEAPSPLRDLFQTMDDGQAIMLQKCFYDFATKMLNDSPDIQRENINHIGTALFF